MNEYIAAVVDELYELGIREVVLSPGSRSTPLSMFFCEHKYSVYLNIDERAAGFFALGIAKERNRPVALVCTSGSAAAHYLPAVMEAKYTRVPLLILTADRPPECKNVGAPQTIDQTELFGGFVNYYEELAPPDPEHAFTYPRMVMRKAWLKCEGTPKGPVQINVPLREPLVPELDRQYFVKGRSQESFRFLTGTMHAEFDASCLCGKKGVMICGADASCDCQREILALADRLKAPVLADPLSNLRSFASTLLIDSYDAFLKDGQARVTLKPDYILMFGQPPVSKRLQQFLTLHKTARCFQIDPAAEYRNPSLSTTQYIQAETGSFASGIRLVNSDASYLKGWQRCQQKMCEKLETARLETELFEGKIVQLIQEEMPEEGVLAVANSMAIRDVDYFWRSGKQNIRIFCNRGTNGIDGTISTALGIAANKSPTVLLTGDLSFFHDMNGFLIGKTHALDLVVVLLNNDGGGIFQYLPQKGARHFDYLFTASHGTDFGGVGVLYGVRYHRVGSYEEFQHCFRNAVAAKGMTVIELSTQMERSVALHEKYTTP